MPFQRISCDFGRAYQTSGHSKTTGVANCSCDSICTITQPDRVVSVSDHVWVSMKADRIDQWRFSVVAVSDDVLAKETRGLMPIPDDDHVAVQRIPSSDLPMLASRAVDGMRTSPGNPNPRSIRDETLPGCQDEDVDKINLWNRLSKWSETAEQGDARYRHVLELAPSGPTLYCVLEPPYACRSMLSLWEKGLPFKECIISLLDGKQRHPAYLLVNSHGREPVTVCRSSLGTRGNEEVVLCKLTVIDSWLEDAFSDDQNLRATVARKNREEPDLEGLFGKVRRCD